VETLQRPAVGEPVNVQIIVSPPFGTGGNGNSSSVVSNNNNNNASQDVSSSTSEVLRNGRDAEKLGASETGSSNTNNNDKDDNGVSRRRGIFPLPSLESPATINIQIPGKLPFNPLEIFNVKTFKSFVQSVTDKFMTRANGGSSRGYKTGFGDSVTIISEDESDNAPNRGFRDDKHDFGGVEDRQPRSERLSGRVRGEIMTESSETKMAEESMIDRQVATLNEVLTNEMNHDKTKSATSPSPLRVSFLPDLSALGQLFNWGEQSARSLAVCNACRVAFGLFVSQVRSYKKLIC